MDIEDLLRNLNIPITDGYRIAAADEIRWLRSRLMDLQLDLELAIAEEGSPLNPMMGH